MRLDRDRRGLDVRAVSRSVLGIGLAGEVALGPAVVAAVLDDVDVLRRKVIAQVVAVVIPAPKLARFRIERDADRVAQPLREDVTARSIQVELRHGGAHRVALVAEIARGTDCHIQLAIGSEHDRASRVTATGQPHQFHRIAGAWIEADELALCAYVHRIAAKAMPKGPFNPLAIVVTTLSATPS